MEKTNVKISISERTLEFKNVVDYYETDVFSSGNGGRIKASKKNIGKKVVVLVLEE